MKLRFERIKGLGNFFIVREVGEASDNVQYEQLGLICLNQEDPFLKVNENFSGILGLKELEAITTFIREMLN